MSNKSSIHRDKLGRDIVLGNYVAVTDSNELRIARVIKLNPRMVKVEVLKTDQYYWKSRTYNKYGSQMIIIDDRDVTMYLLKN